MATYIKVSDEMQGEVPTLRFELRPFILHSTEYSCIYHMVGVIMRVTRTNAPEGSTNGAYKCLMELSTLSKSGILLLGMYDSLPH